MRYVDDLIICSQKPAHVIQELRDSGYELKGGSAPETFLGATIGRHTFNDGTSTWYQSAKQYLKDAIKEVEEQLGKPLKAGKVMTPLETTIRKWTRHHYSTTIAPIITSV